MADLTSREIENGLKLFADLDVDGNGTLDFAEVSAGLKRIGLWCGERHARVLFREIDVSGNGSVDQDEWLDMLGRAKEQPDQESQFASSMLTSTTTRPRAPGISEQDLANYRAVFESMDTNNSGELDREEFTSALKALGVFESDAAAVQLFASADTDHSGTLGLPEFVALMHRAKNGGAGALQEVANDGAAALKRLQANTGLTFSFEDVLRAESTEKSVTQVESYLRDDAWPQVPSTQACSEPQCNLIFNILVFDTRMAVDIITVLCEAMMGEIDAKMAMIGVANILAAVNKEAVVKDAVRIFVVIAHRHAHTCDVVGTPSPEQLQELHSLRKTAMAYASDTSVNEVREFAKATATRLRKSREASRVLSGNQRSLTESTMESYPAECAVQ